MPLTTKKLRKQAAQDSILEALSSAYYNIADDDNLDAGEKELLFQDLDVQRNRIEKLFGYTVCWDRPW